MAYVDEEKRHQVVGAKALEHDSLKIYPLTEGDRRTRAFNPFCAAASTLATMFLSF